MKKQVNPEELANIIGRIKKTYIANWKADHFAQLENLLGIIDLNKGIPLPVLSICGQGTQEVRFTKYLAYFLDAKKNHGLKDLFFKELFGETLRASGLDLDQIEDYEVMPGVYIGTVEGEGSTLDIAVEGEGFYIAIEHKVLSGESASKVKNMTQLKKYSLALKGNQNLKNKKVFKFYLTPQGEDKPKHGWKGISHEELVAGGIKALKRYDISGHSKGNLVRFLLDLAIGPYELMEDNLKEIICLAQQLKEEAFELNRATKYSRLKDEYNQVLEILMEV